TAKPLEAQIGVLAEVEGIKKFGVTNEQLARAKALIAQSRYHEIETVSGMAEDLAHHEALVDWKRSLSYLRAIQKVSADDVIRIVLSWRPLIRVPEKRRYHGIDASHGITRDSTIQL